LAVPSYDASAVTAGIVHIGPGAFHRAHQAAYVDDLLELGHVEWGISAVGLLPGDRRLHDVLPRQGHRYTLALKHPDGALSGRVIGSVGQHLYGPTQAGAVLDALSDPRVRIVTLTITEGGYDVGAAEIPSGAFDVLCRALRRRRDAGTAPFTVLSCDNIEGNGETARAALTACVSALDPAPASWIEQEVTCPSSMVDRITPATTDADRRLVTQTWAVDDDVPVIAEPFRQWVLEDAFPAGRPPWEDVGVQVVADVRPYELMKLRLLNGGHQALAYVGVLLGYTYVHEAAADPLVQSFLRRYLAEAVTTLDAVPGIDLDDYQRTLFERFGNAQVRDTLARICAFTSDRIPRWVVPVAQHRRASGQSATICAAVVATWARYLRGTDDQGKQYDVVDARRDALPPGISLLSADDLFGGLSRDEVFVADVTSFLDKLDTVGTAKALAEL
jgi:mannitol 2-dehydrogenase